MSESRQKRQFEWSSAVVFRPTEGTEGGEVEIVSPTIEYHDLDMTTNADWMEYIRRTTPQGRGDAGSAYETIRCDYLFPEKHDEMAKCWHTWGEDFHFERLVRSHNSLHSRFSVNKTSQCSTGGGESATEYVDSVIERALDHSRRVIQSLLKKASAFLESGCDGLVPMPSLQRINVVRVSLLWSVFPLITSYHKGEEMSSRGNTIVVHGHACCNFRPEYIHCNVEPIVVSIAYPDFSRATTSPQEEGAVSPRRRDPNVKVASWTRERKELENPGAYKPEGVSEVLMVRATQSNSHSLELLEGLSSNLFVVYADGTLHTAHTGVLYGYVRQLVLGCATACGLRTVEQNLPPNDSFQKESPTLPVFLEDAAKGRWREVFITSSSRLVYPVSRVWMRQAETEGKQKPSALVDIANTDAVPAGFVEVWRDPLLATLPYNLSESCEVPKWKMILNQIFLREGYTPVM
jgi:Amino-transferase class IV